MSFYNMLFGQNSKSDLLLAVLGVKQVDVPRFRDVYVDDNGKTLTIHTRTGGGNRESYREENAALTKLPGYKGDYDDDFDSTYANFEYNTPDEWVQDVANLSDIMQNGLRAEFCQHIAKTLNRPATEEDEAQKAYNAESAALKRTGHFMANGHTFVPKNDHAMETALKLAEANDGELLSCWGIAPLNLAVKTDFLVSPGHKDEEERKRMSRVDVSYDFGWSIDHEYWAHCQDLFGVKYPKSMAKIAELVERYKDKKPMQRKPDSPELIKADQKIKDQARTIEQLQRKLARVREATQ